MNYPKIAEYIQNWLRTYCESAGTNGFIIGISGGIDSALTSTLCARTGKKVIVLNLPIRQTAAEYARAVEHIADLEKNGDRSYGYFYPIGGRPTG